MSKLPFGQGAIDRRDDYFKPRSWRNEEIAGTFQPAKWEEKNPTTGFVTYPKRDQGIQSSCVSYVLAKQLAVDELSENGQYRELSPRSLYPYTYVPGGGSNSLEATKLVVKQGMTLEQLLPSDGLSESEIRKDTGYVTDAKQIALVYKPEHFIECGNDMETIASIIQGHRDQGMKKAVALTLIGSNNGTWLTAIPKPPKWYETPWYHRILVTDFGLIDGKKVLAFDNSWGERAGNKGQQFLTTDYMPYTYGGIYTLNQPDNWQQMGTSTVKPPSYQWYNDLSIGSRGADVTALQVALQSMGMFPISSIVKPTGAFYGVTQKGVEIFQASMALPVTGKVDKATRTKLNSIFK